MGEVVIAFDPLPVNTAFQVVAVARNPLDVGKFFRMYGFDVNGFPIYDTDGEAGFSVPIGMLGSLTPPNPAGASLVRCERVFRDPTLSFIDLWSCDSTGKLLQWLSTYWPDETEPKYRRIMLGISPTMWQGAGGGVPTNPVIRMRYRKRWRKVHSLTDPIHLRSRQAIYTAFQGSQLRGLNAMMAPGQGIMLERAAYETAVKYLNDEWRSLHPQEGLDLQVDELTWPAVMNNYESMT
jgi:hypothetical protein